MDLPLRQRSELRIMGHHNDGRPGGFFQRGRMVVEWAVRLGKEEKEAVIILLHALAPLLIFPESGYEVERLFKDR